MAICGKEVTYTRQCGGGIVGLLKSSWFPIDLELEIFDTLWRWRSCQRVHARIGVVESLGSFEEEGWELGRGSGGGSHHGGLRSRSKGELAE